MVSWPHMKNNNDPQKPLVGFFPAADNLAECGRAVMIAKRLQDLGSNIIFFSHGRKYDFLIEKNGFTVIHVQPDFKDELIHDWYKLAELNIIYAKSLVDYTWLAENIKAEIEAFTKTGIDLLVSTNSITCAISARAAHIPYINIKPGAGAVTLSIPDFLNNGFTRLIPKQLSTKLFTWCLQRTKLWLKPVNKVAKDFGVPPFKRSLDLWEGDTTLLTSHLEFINIFPHQQLWPAENYVGMTLLDEIMTNTFSQKEIDEIETKIAHHLNKPGKSILVTLGSSGDKDFFIQLLKALEKTAYNIVVVYTSVLDTTDVQDLHLTDNIFMLPFVPSINKLHHMVDLAIIHGGQGTVYSAVYAKKPVIGIPQHFEQQLNLEKLVGHGMGIMLSKKYFSEQQLYTAINEVFNNYDTYCTKAEKLGNTIHPPQGDINTAKIIMKMVQEKNSGPARI
jgi:UDP:flavonoid glycosyltransferase YjiC (YdhE family)